MSCSTPAAAPIAEEAELVARLQRADAAAFERLVRAYGPRMLSVARRFLGNDEDAQDALQDAFLSAFRSSDRFAGESRLGTWLHRIVVNASLMRLRTRRRRPETSIDDLLPQFQEDGHQIRSSVPWRQPVDVMVQKRETADLVRRSIDQLPENYRIVLMLRDIEERDTDETARLLGISVAAVKTRLHRARQALRTLLDAHLQGDPL